MLIVVRRPPTVYRFDPHTAKKWSYAETAPGVGRAAVATECFIDLRQDTNFLSANNDITANCITDIEIK
ncbi:hypothetical protein RCH14_003232 [Massilia sp. MP_M2]|uniref:hypothetical protein n=1 Tax=Massilia sp. MP_M2 TaxID=3071713 RepID=UPI00319DE3F2